MSLKISTIKPGMRFATYLSWLLVVTLGLIPTQSQANLITSSTVGGGPGSFFFDLNDPTKLLADPTVAQVLSVSGPGINNTDSVIGMPVSDFQLQFASDPRLGPTTLVAYNWTIWEVAWTHGAAANPPLVTVVGGILTVPLQPVVFVSENVTGSPPTGSPFVDLMINISNGLSNGSLSIVEETIVAEINLNDGSGFETSTIEVVPEPSTYLLFAISILGILGMGYRQRNKSYRR